MASSKRSTNVTTELIAGLDAVIPWPSELGPCSPVVSMIFSKNLKYRAAGDWLRLPGDILELARLSTFQADAIALQRKLDGQGHTITTPGGAIKVNPNLTALATVNGQIGTLARQLGTGTASQSTKRKRANASAQAHELEQTYGTDHDSLLN